MDIEQRTDFSYIANLIRAAKSRAQSNLNRELIDLYWNIGKYITEKAESDGWGKGTVKSLSAFITSENPGIKGFSSQNIWRMKQFYETYSDDVKLSALLRELSWTNNLMIMSKSTSREEREFYITLSIRERYTSRELERQIDTCFFERVLTSGDPVLSLPLEEMDAAGALRDSYMLDFLGLPDNHSEGELKDSILANMKRFILEFGKDFIYIDKEYRLQVGNNDYRLDLLFFHRELCCLVAIELKITDFKPEYLGKMNFYLEALDRDVKKQHENPSVGIILCKSKDIDVVEYALSRNISPAMVADYQTKLIDKTLLIAALKESSNGIQESEQSD